MLADYLYGKIILSIFMAVCAALDLCRKQIDKRIFIAMLIASAGGYVWMIASGKEVLWVRILIGVAVGVFIAGLSIITKSSIGMGDAVFFCLTGLVMGCRTVLVFAGSILLCAVISIVVCAVGLIRGEGIKNKAIPFIPVVLPVGIAMFFFSEQLGLG